MAPSQLYYDVILKILEYYRRDYDQLFTLSLVNKEFNRAASNMLYSRVVLSPPQSRQHQLNLGNRNPITGPSNLPSAILPRYAKLLLELEISGYLDTRPPPRNTLHAVLADALRHFPNIRSIKYVPATFPKDLFLDSLNLLANPPPSYPQYTYLRELTLNESCTSNAEHTALLAGNLKGLAKLTLHSPPRSILLVLPEWLALNKGTIEELHLLDNCGSVTPGVLKMMVPHVKERLKAFSLGLSYSITNEDLFQFLNHLQAKLQKLQVRYYYQQTAPHTTPSLPHLHTLTALLPSHSPLSTHPDVRALTTFIRLLTSSSPTSLHTLRILPEPHGPIHLHAPPAGDDYNDNDNDSVDIDAISPYHPPHLRTIHRTGASPGYDGLIDSLTAKHSNTLRILHAPGCLVRTRYLRRLLGECRELESLQVSIGVHTLTALPTILSSSSPPPAPPPHFHPHSQTHQGRLHTASFYIQFNLKNPSTPTPPKFTFTQTHAEACILPTTNLRRLTIDGRVNWEGSWKVVEKTGDGDGLEFGSATAANAAVELVVSPHPRGQPVPPWRRRDA